MGLAAPYPASVPTRLHHPDEQVSLKPVRAGPAPDPVAQPGRPGRVARDGREFVRLEQVQRVAAQELPHAAARAGDIELKGECDGRGRAG